MSPTPSPTLLPTVLDSPGSPVYPKSSRQSALAWYGQQLSTATPSLRHLLLGQYPTSDIVRWHQVNRFVTSGTSPGGGEAGFNDEHRQWDVRVREETRGMVEADSLSDLLVFEKMVSSVHSNCGLSAADSVQSVPEALRRAADLAARIRGHQTLMDGNHRSGLLCFVLSLAEARVLLRPDFSTYRAYIILSARQHRDNRDNILLGDAMDDTASALFRYARRRVRPGEPDFSYLAEWSETIRQLPLYAGHIEALYRSLSQVTAPAIAEGRLQSRKDAWSRLSDQEKRHLKLAHPTFTPIDQGKRKSR